jgi:hypothetical protein
VQHLGHDLGVVSAECWRIRCRGNRVGGNAGVLGIRWRRPFASPGRRIEEDARAYDWRGEVHRK